MAALLKWLRGRQQSSSDVDTAWRQQNKEQQENALFQLVDFTPHGGQLVRAFTEHGTAGVVQVAHEHMSNFLYHSGMHNGRVTRLDYARWLARKQDKLSGTHEYDHLSDAELLARYAPEEGKFMQLGEHDACWELSKRGPVGETALHLCFLNDTPVHREIAWTLLDIYPSLALDIYEGAEYYGESALHFAIVYGDLESVKLLVRKGAKVDQRATGNFFLPEDQKKIPKARHTNYKGYAYYGEYPLSFAASLGLQSIYDYLISEGADANACDIFGNTALHMAVINNQSSMYTYAVRRQYPSTRADPWMRNKSGYTPLSLACKLGQQKMFEEMLEIHSIELWRFSNIHCSLYPLHAIDTIGSSGLTNWNSALMIITNEKSEAHLEMLQSRVMLQLLDEKWKTFVRKKFLQRFVLAIVHLLLLSAAVYLRPDSDITNYSDTKSIVRLVCEITVSIVCSLTIIFSLNTLRICGIRHYMQSLTNVPSIGLFIVACVLVLCCIPLRLAALILSSSETRHELLLAEETLLIFALPTSWAVMLFFAKAQRLTGDSVLMLYKILRGDMIRFVLIYVIFLMCFSQAFYSLFRNSNPANEKYETFPGTVMSMFLMTLQEYDFTDFDDTRIPALTKTVFILFMFLMPILLLNMLIAMMGETYEKQLRENRSRKDWVAQWAKVVIFLERAFSDKELLGFQKAYSVLRDQPPEADRTHLDREAVNGDSEYRALMTIKESSKTKAKQRQGALQNWKAALKHALAAVKAARAAGHPPDRPVTYHDLFPDSHCSRLGDLGLPNTPLQCRNTLQVEALKAAVDQLSWEWQATSAYGSSAESNYTDRSRGTIRADSVEVPVHLPPLDEVMGSPSGSSCGSTTPSHAAAHRLAYGGQLYEVHPGAAAAAAAPAAGDERVVEWGATSAQPPAARVSIKRPQRREESHPASLKYL